MPSIKTNDEQQEALNEITAKMEILSELSSFNARNIDEITIILGKPGRGRKTGTRLVLSPEEKEGQKVFGALSDYRKRIVKEIRDKAKKFNICFDPDEEALLYGDSFVRNAEPEQTEPIHKEDEQEPEAATATDERLGTEEPLDEDTAESDFFDSAAQC